MIVAFRVALERVTQTPLAAGLADNVGVHVLGMSMLRFMAFWEEVSRPLAVLPASHSRPQVADGPTSIFKGNPWMTNTRHTRTGKVLTAAPLNRLK